MQLKPATLDNVGEWEGQEALAAGNFNLVLRAFQAAIDSALDAGNDSRAEEIYLKANNAWDYWGSREELLTLTEEDAQHYVNSVIG